MLEYFENKILTAKGYLDGWNLLDRPTVFVNPGYSTAVVQAPSARRMDFL
jgi:hypothetical protein